MSFRKARVYKQIIKTGIIRSLTYKFQVYSNILMQTIIMVASAYFWKALFKNAESVKGVSIDTMLVYIIISSIISIVLSTNVERRIEESVERGSVAVDLMRPINVFSIYFAEDIASLIALFFQNVIPVLVIGTIIIGIPKAASLAAFLLFLLSLFMAYMINWFIAVMFGMICFSQVRVSALFQVKKHLIRLLSGSIIPIWFFPDWLQRVLKTLPFAYLYQLPLDIYVGKSDSFEIMMGLIVQLIWMIITFALFMHFQKEVTKKVLVQGG